MPGLWLLSNSFRNWEYQSASHELPGTSVRGGDSEWSAYALLTVSTKREKSAEYCSGENLA